MKKLLTLLAISVFAFGFSMRVCAAPKPSSSDAPSPTATPTPAATPAPDKSRPFPFHGDVSAVDSTAKTFTLKNKVGGSDRVFHVGENVKPAKEGWSGEFSSITVGIFATGTCTKTGDRRFEVATLHIGTKPVKKATPTAKPNATPKAMVTPKPM
jgi:hypothetical protein